MRNFGAPLASYAKTVLKKAPDERPAIRQVCSAPIPRKTNDNDIDRLREDSRARERGRFIGSAIQSCSGNARRASTKESMLPFAELKSQPFISFREVKGIITLLESGGDHSFTVEMIACSAISSPPAGARPVVAEKRPPGHLTAPANRRSGTATAPSVGYSVPPAWVAWKGVPAGLLRVSWTQTKRRETR